MRMNRRNSIALITGAALCPTTALASNNGLAISKERYARDRGWRDSMANASMNLILPGRNATTREMETKVLETTGDGDLSITEFNTPRDLKGTKFLTHSFAEAPDDQWIFLPEAGKVRRISSRNKSSSFLGSEFTYEDLSTFKVQKYDYQHHGSETVSGLQCHVVGQIPRYKHTGYNEVIVWLDKEHLRPIKSAFFDRRGQQFKSMTFSKYERYAGKFWRAHQVEMQNLKNGKITRIDFSGFRFAVGMSSNEFDPGRLG